MIFSQSREEYVILGGGSLVAGSEDAEFRV